MTKQNVYIFLNTFPCEYHSFECGIKKKHLKLPCHTINSIKCSTHFKATLMGGASMQTDEHANCKPRTDIRPQLSWRDAMRWLTGEGGDVVFEEALGFAGLGHEARERSLHVPPLSRRFLADHLVVRHRLPKCLQRGQRGPVISMEGGSRSRSSQEPLHALLQLFGLYGRAGWCGLQIIFFHKYTNSNCRPLFPPSPIFFNRKKKLCNNITTCHIYFSGTILIKQCQ